MSTSYLSLSLRMYSRATATRVSLSTDIFPLSISSGVHRGSTWGGGAVTAAAAKDGVTGCYSFVECDGSWFWSSKMKVHDSMHRQRMQMDGLPSKSVGWRQCRQQTAPTCARSFSRETGQRAGYLR